MARPSTMGDYDYDKIRVQVQWSSLAGTLAEVHRVGKHGRPPYQVDTGTSQMSNAHPRGSTTEERYGITGQEVLSRDTAYAASPSPCLA